MKAIAFAQRLLRDIKEKDLASLNADTRLELTDAINGAIARMHSVAPPHSKITKAAITLPAPTEVTLTLLNGSVEIAGYDPVDDDAYCTIRIEGDGVDNQITSNGSLLFPYSGTDGDHDAVIYHDASVLPEPFEEIIEDPEDIRYGERLLKDETQEYRFQSPTRRRQLEVGNPTRWWVESNAANQGMDAPLIFRVGSLPSELVRLQTKVSMGPARISFQSLLNGTAVLPMRHEHIEAYLLPIARGILSSSTLWREADTKDSASRQGETAQANYMILSPKTTSSPQNRVYTPSNF